MNKFPITKKGFEKLTQELKYLKHVKRPQVIEAIKVARELGDLSENAEYQAAREQQSFIEGRILDLEDKSARADIIDITKLSGNTIKFGATVTLIDNETEKEIIYHIVGEYEADMTKRYISIMSPIARALIGKEKGDVIEVSTPLHTKSYEVIGIQYKDLMNYKTTPDQ